MKAQENKVYSLVEFRLLQLCSSDLRCFGMFHSIIGLLDILSLGDGTNVLSWNLLDELSLTLQNVQANEDVCIHWHMLWHWWTYYGTEIWHFMLKCGILWCTIRSSYSYLGYGCIPD